MVNDPRRGSFEVILSLRSQLSRYGVESILGSVDLPVTLRSHEDLDTALKVSRHIVETCDEATVVLLVALTEIDASASPGLAAAHELGVKVLVMVDDVDGVELGLMAKASGSGFLFADELDAATLALALRRLQDGEMAIPPRLTRLLLSAAGDGEPDTGVRTDIRLLPRERHVLALLVEGLSNKQIARQLGVSEGGAKRHVATILAKLNCRNRTVLVAKAVREGLCDPI
jgi:DNA-binding NarL/FixJ family response regulator